MKRLAEVVPAAGLALLIILLAILQLLGVNVVGRSTAITGAISLILGLLVLGLCITGPLVWGVLYFVERTRSNSLDVMEAKCRPDTRGGGASRKFWFGALKSVTAVIVGVPVLFLATCAYTSYSPHLRRDPILVAIMDAPPHPEHGWATRDVPLAPTFFHLGEEQESVMARLKSSGFELQAYYSTEVGISHDRPAGIPFTLKRHGRTRLACSETLFVQVDFVGGALTQINGSGTWTCL